MKKTRLIVDYDYEFHLLGVISSIKFYKLAWAINNQLHIRLLKEEDHELNLKNNKKVTFGQYIFETENSIFQLYKNKSESDEIAYLLPEMSHFDYVIKLDANSQSFAKEEVLKELREVKWIEYIAPIEVENLKSKDNFLS